jgi:hypothetical protein
MVDATRETLSGPRMLAFAAWTPGEELSIKRVAAARLADDAVGHVVGQLCAARDQQHAAEAETP